MLSNSGPVAKLYLSIIDDVIESVRELFLDEGLEERVLDDLKHLWESKMMQSKVMEELRKNGLNSSNFVLQLPAHYRHPDQEVTALAVNQANQNNQSFPRLKNSSETLATFSLPAGLSYPVQIPAGVTLQTASGQLYKVNVPVVVTQAAAGQPSAGQRKATERREAPPPPPPLPPQSAALSASITRCQEVGPSALSHPNGNLPVCPESGPPEQPPAPQEASHLQGTESSKPHIPPEENDPSSQAEPIDLTAGSPPRDELFDFQIAEEPSTHGTARLKSSDIDDILQKVIEEERLKAEMARNLTCVKPGSQSDELLGLDLDYSYSDLSDIVQLDGPADNSGEEDVDGAALDDDDFLGLINAEAMKALQDGAGSSDGNSVSSGSDSEVPDDLSIVEEEDPLNSGDDVIEQDIPDLFDTDNVIVCQYDKIHRSKNRWKFHLKDGVMCYGGREYVFSKAVGEAEW